MPRALTISALALLLAGGAPAAMPTHAVPPSLPRSASAGPWISGHVQGIAVDRQGGFIYYSFTNLLAKYDFQGRLVGTLSGWTGHLGDLDFRAADGKVYGSLEYKHYRAFYIAIVDVRRIDRVGIDASATDILRTVYLPEVTKDYAADLNGDGRVDDSAASPDHRYGCSGIDGLGFGPAFGRSDGRQYLTVAYGIYGAPARRDNDHQVLLQYDVAGWTRLARPLREAAPHRSGPDMPAGKFFVRTGNTRFGVQTLAYDPGGHRWFMGVYQGSKPDFPNYRLFAIDGRAAPAHRALVGVSAGTGSGWEMGQVVPLAADGAVGASGVRGWMEKADVGFQPVGDSLFYVAENEASGKLQSARLTLKRWTGSNDRSLKSIK